LFENFTYTDWLLICVLWFQVATLLHALWPKLSRFKLIRKVPKVRGRKAKAKGKDAYEELFGKNGGETHE
jgi:hypothetical protein